MRRKDISLSENTSSDASKDRLLCLELNRQLPKKTREDGVVFEVTRVRNNKQNRDRSGVIAVLNNEQLS